MGNLKKLFIFYFSFNGRVTRFDFGVRFILMYIILSIVASFIDFQISSYLRNLVYPTSTGLNLTAFISALAVSTKRFHDLNLSGRWSFIITVPLVLVYLSFSYLAMLNPFMSTLYLSIAWFFPPFVLVPFILFLLMKKGTSGANKYGPDPLEKLEHETVQ